MNQPTHFKSALIMGALLALSYAPVHAATQTTLMSRTDYKSGKARISADYKMDKRACDDQTGNAKDVCMEEAKAIKTKAMTDAKLGKEVSEAVSDATEGKMGADYRVATEKCDSMTMDNKSNCIAQAKIKFKQN